MTYFLPLPSDEQMAIINAVFLNKNVIVNAVSGSGKSTCVLSMAKFINKQILQITYNKSLRHEVKQKAKSLGLGNISVHTYHSLACKYYDRLSYMDGKIDEIVARDMGSLTEIKKYDIIVIDEAQDMTMSLFRLMRKFARDMGGIFTMIIMGDEYQAVYEFMGANKRFLTMGQNIWADKWNKWDHLPLGTSYRVTNQIAAFVNNVMLGQQRITACKDGPAVDYITSGSFNGLDIIYNILAFGKYKPGDIFILLASVKGAGEKVPYKNLENMLVRAGWPVFVPSSDESTLSDNIVAGKVVFSTFHQSKGRERPVVVILGFDNSYFRFYARNLPTDECPSTLYVAATRASHKLIILDNSCDNHGRLPFLKNYGFQGMDFIKHWGILYKGQVNNSILPEKHNCAATHLTRFLRTSIVVDIIHLLGQVFECVAAPGDSVQLLAEYQQEEVADINGMVIPMIYEWRNTGSATIIRYIEQFIAENLDNPYRTTVLDGLCINVRPECPADFIKLGVIYHAISNGLMFKLAQIRDYNWLSGEEIDWCLGHMPANCVGQFEYEITKIYRSVQYGEIYLNGRLDMITADAVYEIKCVDTLTVEHKLQLLIYAVILAGQKESTGRNFKLLNLKNGECWQLVENWPIIGRIFELLLDNKFSLGEVLGDVDFINAVVL